jgi:hypothetical protein
MYAPDTLLCACALCFIHLLFAQSNRCHAAGDLGSNPAQTNIDSETFFQLHVPMHRPLMTGKKITTLPPPLLPFNGTALSDSHIVLNCTVYMFIM